MYVEDDEDIAELTQLILKNMGEIEIMHCPSGQEALDAFPIFKPQMVLMDVMMPEMDGPETFEHLKKIPNGKTTPVVFITAKAQTHEQESYLKLGALGVIPKPCGPIELCQKLNDLWEKFNGS